MGWSIRGQILVPLVGIQVVAVMAATLATASLAARRIEGEIIARLNDVLETVGQGGFPHTFAVLGKMRKLSGAHFLTLSNTGKLAESTLAGLTELPESLAGLTPKRRVESLDRDSAIEVQGTRYFAVRLDSRADGGDESFLILYPETTIQQARREAATPPLVLGTGALALMIVVTSWIAHRMSQRIGRIRGQVARIAAGDFQDVAMGADHSGDEVDELAGSINQMCADLREMRRGIEQTERARLLAQVAAGFAHQLRNSLSGARMCLQLYLRRHPDAAVDPSIQVALRQLEMTEEQMKALLLVGRVEEGPAAPCDLDRLLDEVESFVEPSCRHARVDLTRHGSSSDQPRLILADRSNLRGAILNLTLNAIEAAGVGGWVRLQSRDGDQELAIEVIDGGPGPPIELADRLCEPFVTSKPEGAGLGLALASRVATSHGGRLTWSRAEGETRFRMSLPRLAASPGAAP